MADEEIIEVKSSSFPQKILVYGGGFLLSYVLIFCVLYIFLIGFVLPFDLKAIISNSTNKIRTGVQRTNNIESLKADSTAVAPVDSITISADSLATLLRQLELERQAYNQKAQELEAAKEEHRRLKAELETLNNSPNSINEGKLRQLAKVYEAMRAEEAASILEHMNELEVIDILSRIKDRQAAKILSAMEPKRAAQLSHQLANL